MRICVCLSVCMNIQCLQRSEETSKPLELEFQMVVSCLTWVLGTEHLSSGRTASAPKHWAPSPDPTTGFLIGSWGSNPGYILKDKSHYVAQAVLDLWSSCSSLRRAGVAGLQHHPYVLKMFEHRYNGSHLNPSTGKQGQSLSLEPAWST